MAMKKSVCFLFALFPLLGCLSSCGNHQNGQVSLSYGSLFEEGDDPQSHFAQSIRSINGEQKTTYLTPYSTLKTLVERKESFLLVNVPSFSCLCYSQFRDNCLLPYMKEHNLQIYLMRQSELEEQKKADRYGIDIVTDPAIAIFSNGKLLTQKEAKTGDPFHDSYADFSSWMNQRVASFPKMLYVNDRQLDALYSGNDPFLIYYARFSCSDCSYFQTNFLTDYLKKREKPLSSAYLIDCDQEGIRALNGEYNEGQWNAYKQSHGLAYSEENPAGYNGGYVPTLMRISPNDGKKKGEVIQAMDVFLNDSYEKKEDGSYFISDSYFDEDRLETPALSYLKNSSVSQKVLKGMNLGQYESEMPYSVYQEKMAPYHEAIAKVFLDSF